MGFTIICKGSAPECDFWVKGGLTGYTVSLKFLAAITILVVPEVSFLLYHAELTSLVCSSVTVLITMRKLKTDPSI